MYLEIVEFPLQAPDLRSLIGMQKTLLPGWEGSVEFLSSDCVRGWSARPASTSFRCTPANRIHQGFEWGWGRQPPAIRWYGKKSSIIIIPSAVMAFAESVSMAVVRHEFKLTTEPCARMAGSTGRC